jgi:ABC-type antimicrobial peptide transport system ATPase subunit
MIYPWCATFSNRIAVMYLGNIAEIGPAELIYKTPMHPYLASSSVGSSLVPIPTFRVQSARICRATFRIPSTNLQAAASARGVR